MDQPRKPFRRTAVRSLALLAGGIALGTLWRGRSRDVVAPAALEGTRAPASEPTPVAVAQPRRRGAGTRLGVAAIYVALFVAGGALTAWGGNEVTQLVADTAPATVGDTTPATVGDTTTTAAAVPDAGAPAPEAPAADASAPEAPAPEVAAPEAPAAAPESDAATPTPHELPSDESAAAPVAAGPEPAPAPAAAPPQPVAVNLPVHVAAPAAASPRQRIVAAARTPSVGVDPELTSPSAASVIWLNAPLPDPTPPSRRPQRSFVHALYGAFGTEWPLALAVLRADGLQGRAPAGPQALDALSIPLGELRRTGRGDRQTAFSLLGDVTLADRAEALAHYYRAVGTETLVVGLGGSKARLERRVLADPRISIYPAGRGDVESGRVDVRVLAVVSYLADTFGGVQVSSLVSGHREFARPGVVSAHVYGRGLDVAALGPTPIAGHQEPGGVTEQAVRSLLLLPVELQPRQVISLLGLGGRSLALADHADHIHVGY